MNDDDTMHPDPAYVGNKPPCDFAWTTANHHGGTHACTRKQQGHDGMHLCECGAEK